MGKPSSRLLVWMSLLCLLLASCNDADNPLSDPAQSKADSRLLGTWRLRGDDGQVTYYHVSRAGDKLPEAVLYVDSVRPTKDGKKENGDPMLVFPAAIGDHAYLNVAFEKDGMIKSLVEGGWKPGRVAVYTIWKYRVDGDQLTIQVMDDDAKRRAIQSGQIKGLIKDDKKIPRTIMFTDTPENLVRFVGKAGESLFDKEAFHLERDK